MISRRNDAMRVMVWSTAVARPTMKSSDSQAVSLFSKYKLLTILAIVFIFSVTQVTFGAVLPTSLSLLPNTAYAVSAGEVYPTGTDVSVETTAIVVNFAQEMDVNQALSPTDVNISGSPGIGLSLLDASWDADGLVLTLPLSGMLEWATAYTVNIRGLTSESGIPMLFDRIHMFRTESDPNDDGRPRVTQIAAGSNHSLTIRDDGTLWAWGSNTFGQLGLDDTVRRDIPTLVSDVGISGDEWIAVSAGQNHTLALRDSGALYAWGANGNGQLGIGVTAGTHNVPRLVSTAGVSGAEWTAVSAGFMYTIALRDNGELYAWGNNALGQLGIGTAGNAFNAPQVVSTTGVSGDDWVALSQGKNHTLALRDSGALYAWGVNASGQLGVGDVLQKNSPTAVITTGVSGDRWTDIFTGQNHTLALRDNGELYAWGANGNGQLGIGTLIGTRTAPEIVPVHATVSGDRWTAISAGLFYTLAIRDDGTLWAWGNNATGQLGIGAAGTPRTIPAEVEIPEDEISGDEWTAVLSGHNHTLALRDDGTLWSWGHNNYGQLGKGITTPVGQQGSGTNNWVPWRVAASLLPTSGTNKAVADTATVPNNGADDVDDSSIVIRFDRSMRTGADYLGVITIDRGATVDMAAGTWSECRMIFTVPLTLVEDGVEHRATVRGFVDDFLGWKDSNEMHYHTWTFTTGKIDKPFEGDSMSYDGSTCSTCHFTESIRLEHQFVASRGMISECAANNDYEYGCQKCHGQTFTNLEKINWNHLSDCADPMGTIDDMGCMTCHGGPGDNVHVDADRMLSAHIIEPAVSGCAGLGCHGEITTASQTGFGFGAMDLASAHADYWIAVQDGRVIDEEAVSVSMQGDNNPFGCGICHSRADDEDSRLKSPIVAHIANEGGRAEITCTSCHVPPEAGDEASMIRHLAQRELVEGLAEALGIDNTQTSARAALTAADFFRALSAEVRAELGFDTDGERLEAEVLRTCDFASSSTTATVPAPFNINCPHIDPECPHLDCISCGPCGVCEICDPPTAGNDGGTGQPVPPTPPATCPCMTGGTCDCDDCDCDSARCTCTVAPQETTQETPTTRDPNAGPATGDAHNWFAQLAVVALLVATIAVAGLVRTREQS